MRILSILSLFFLTKLLISDSRSERAVFLIKLRRIRSSLRFRHYLTRISLPLPSVSSWTKLFLSQNNLSFINVTGFDFASFMDFFSSLMELNLMKPNTFGRKRWLSTEGVLGLTLQWLNSTMKNKTLCQVFGITEYVCSVYIR
eukprot:GCRY01004494.1.p1 GENE.GCRY01004494.1~~GCRY01004494.1.p1  ORF type:complete len:143 (-),score=3.06 GCRY01004494.1:746-1174(-)